MCMACSALFRYNLKEVRVCFSASVHTYKNCSNLDFQTRIQPLSVQPLQKGVSEFQILQKGVSEFQILQKGVSEFQILQKGVSEFQILQKGISEFQILQKGVSEFQILQKGVSEFQIFSTDTKMLRVEPTTHNTTAKQ